MKREMYDSYYDEYSMDIPLSSIDEEEDENDDDGTMMMDEGFSLEDEGDDEENLFDDTFYNDENGGESEDFIKKETKPHFTEKEFNDFFSQDNSSSEGEDKAEGCKIEHLDSARVEELDQREYLVQIQKSKGYYGSIKDKPETEQWLFHLQDVYLNRRWDYQRRVKEWEKTHSSPKPLRKKFSSEKEYIKALASWNKMMNDSIPEDHSHEIWVQMLEVMYYYAQSMILKRNKGKRFMERADVSSKATEAALTFMNQYLRREDFICGTSFSGILGYKIMESFSLNKEDKHISLNELMFDEDSETLLEHLSENSGGGVSLSVETAYSNVEDEVLKDSPLYIVDEVLREVDEEIGGESKLAFLIRLYLVIVLKVPKTRHIKRLFFDLWANEYRLEQLFESVQLELLTRFEQGTGDIFFLPDDNY